MSAGLPGIKLARRFSVGGGAIPTSQTTTLPTFAAPVQRRRMRRLSRVSLRAFGVRFRFLRSFRGNMCLEPRRQHAGGQPF